MNSACFEKGRFVDSLDIVIACFTKGVRFEPCVFTVDLGYRKYPGTGKIAFFYPRIRLKECFAQNCVSLLCPSLLILVKKAHVCDCVNY